MIIQLEICSNHVTHMHDHVIDKLLAYDPPSNWTKPEQFESGSKAKFEPSGVTWSLISKRTSGGSKAKQHVYASRDYRLEILKWIKN